MTGHLNSARSTSRVSAAFLVAVLLATHALVACAKPATIPSAASAAQEAQQAASSAQAAASAAGLSASSAATAASAAASAASSPKAAASAPALIEQVEVAHATWLWLPSAPASSASPSLKAMQIDDDIDVTVDKEEFKAAVLNNDAQPVLFLNGVSMGDDATLQRVDSGGKTLILRYTLHSGTSSQPLWTAIYRRQGIARPIPLEASVGWKGTPWFIEKSKDKSYSNFISVGTWWSVVSGALLCSLLLGIFAWCLRGTDLFRDAPLPNWWLDAAILRKAIIASLNPAKTEAETQKDKLADKARLAKLRRVEASKLLADGQSDKLKTLISITYAKFEWPRKADATPGDPPDFEDALEILGVTATNSLNGAMPGDDPTATMNTVVGLALAENPWRARRLSYSLARVQTAMWVMFSVVAGVFLWVVYGALPALAGSVLALTSVSVVTAGASAIIDSNNQLPPSATRGFLRDLLTGGVQGDAQAHRFQAVVVNLLLLSVGVVAVCQLLAYPVFDPTWLGLLGLSGLAQTAGKQIVETPKTSS